MKIGLVSLSHLNALLRTHFDEKRKPNSSRALAGGGALDSGLSCPCNVHGRVPSAQAGPLNREGRAMCHRGTVVVLLLFGFPVFPLKRVKRLKEKEFSSSLWDLRDRERERVPYGGALEGYQHFESQAQRLCQGVRLKFLKCDRGTECGGLVAVPKKCADHLIHKLQWKKGGVAPLVDFPCLPNFILQYQCPC